MSNNRRNRERNELRLKILNSARELFARGGQGEVTLRNVAAKIEYSVTAIYSHFPSKEALIREVCEAEFAFLNSALHRATQTPDPMDRLRKLASAYVDFGLQHPEQYYFLFLREQAASSPPGRRAGAGQPISPGSANAPQPYDFLREGVFKAVAAGCFRPEYRSVELIAQSLWSSLHGLVALHLVRARHPAVSWKPVQATVEFTLECLLNGLAAPPHQTPPTWIQLTG